MILQIDKLRKGGYGWFLLPIRLMNKIDWNNEFKLSNEEPLKIDFSKIVVPDNPAPTVNFSSIDVVPTIGFDNGIANNLSNGNVSFGSIATAYATDEKVTNPNSNITYLNTNPIFTAKAEPAPKNKVAGNVFSNTVVSSEVKPSVTELQRIVQKLEKLEKMINPNSKKSLILWEEDNSFKNLISSIVSYANSCDTKTEFPIELYDRLKALGEDVDKQIVDGKEKIETLTAQAKENTNLSELLSKAYISATAGLPSEEYEANLSSPELSEYKAQLEVIATADASSEEYKEAEKAVKSKINNLENSVHITIDLERTTSKGGALEYIKAEITPAIERLSAAYIELNKSSIATDIEGEDAITALTVKKSFAEKVYDTFVRPFANLFRRKNKAK